MLRSSLALIALCLFFLSANLSPLAAQEKAPTPEKSPTKEKAQDKVPEKAQEKAPGDKSPTAEQIAESVDFMYGIRAVLDQIRRNGVERGRITRLTSEGKTEELSYERRFIRGADFTKDKVRMDQKMPSMEYSLIYGDGRLWGLINGSAFTPRQDTVDNFMAQFWHSIDALLRYKENGSTITYVDKDKQKGLDLYVVDLTDKENRQTRYYISTKSLHVLWLEYQDSSTGIPIKYTRTFHDYRATQNTLVPYRSVLLADNKQIQETRILNVTFGLKLEDSLFQNPEAQAANP